MKTELRELRYRLKTVIQDALKIEEALSERDDRENDGFASNQLSDLRTAIGDLQSAEGALCLSAGLPIP